MTVTVTDGGTTAQNFALVSAPNVTVTGKVVARLPRGTPLRAGTAAEGWVPVKYGDQFSSEGWVYHSAIGR